MLTRLSILFDFALVLDAGPSDNGFVLGFSLVTTVSEPPVASRIGSPGIGVWSTGSMKGVKF